MRPEGAQLKGVPAAESPFANGDWLQLGYSMRWRADMKRTERPEKSGAGNGIRTRDPLLGKQMLYH